MYVLISVTTVSNLPSLEAFCESNCITKEVKKVTYDLINATAAIFAFAGL
jgi:hypothetical protein